jgi:alanine dehydrogenase
VKITELGEETLRKVDRLVIHTRKWAPDNYITGFNDEKVEAHDPIDLLTEGAKGPIVAPKQPFWLGAPELKDVIAAKLSGRQSAKEITCFNNNIGLGIQFAALGKAIFDDAKAKGLGREIPTDWFLETGASLKEFLVWCLESSVPQNLIAAAQVGHFVISTEGRNLSSIPSDFVS